MIEVITIIAKQEAKSISQVAKELLEEDLDYREDKLLSQLAEQRDAEEVETVPFEEERKKYAYNSKLFFFSKTLLRPSIAPPRSQKEKSISK